MLTNSITTNQNQTNFGMKFNATKKVVDAGRDTFKKTCSAQTGIYNFSIGSFLSAIVKHNKDKANHVLFNDKVEILKIEPSQVPFSSSTCDTLTLTLKSKKMEEPQEFHVNFNASGTWNREEDVQLYTENLKKLQSNVVDKTYSYEEIIENALKKQ